MDNSLWGETEKNLKESQMITDTRRFCAEKTNDSRRIVKQREREDRSSDICHACSEQHRAVRKAQTDSRDPLWCQSAAAADCRRESPCFNHTTQWMTIAEEALGLIEILLLLFPEKYSRPPTSTGAASLRGSTTWSRISRLLIITRSVIHIAAYSG